MFIGDNLFLNNKNNTLRVYINLYKNNGIKYLYISEIWYSILIQTLNDNYVLFTEQNIDYPKLEQ